MEIESPKEVSNSLGFPLFVSLQETMWVKDVCATSNLCSILGPMASRDMPWSLCLTWQSHMDKFRMGTEESSLSALCAIFPVTSSTPFRYKDCFSIAHATLSSAPHQLCRLCSKGTSPLPFSPVEPALKEGNLRSSAWPFSFIYSFQAAGQELEWLLVVWWQEIGFSCFTHKLSQNSSPQENLQLFLPSSQNRGLSRFQDPEAFHAPIRFPFAPNRGRFCLGIWLESTLYLD